MEFAGSIGQKRSSSEGGPIEKGRQKASEYGDTSIHYVKVNGQERPSKREEWDERHLLRPQLP
jgi:hypothetical protein